jgi:FMN phosphatase YigB (HAD superfamily)
MIKAVVFDLWWTLARKKVSLIHSIEKVFRLKHDLKSLEALEQTLMKKRWKSFDEAYFAMADFLGQKPDDKQRKEFCRTVKKITKSSNIIVFPDVKPAFIELKRRGYKIGLISNTTSFNLGFLKPIGRYIDHETKSYEVGLIKPNPSIFRICLSGLGVKAGEAVMVGDTYEHDIIAAKKIGMKAVLLKRKGSDPGFKGAKDKYRYKISSLDELPGILENIR